MVQVYNLKDFYDYIWGNEIPEDRLEELENDPKFMLHVLEQTRDKKMYDFCSDEVKRNYDFVRGVVVLFKDDPEFITNVSNRYLDSLTEEEIVFSTSYIELNIIMSNLLGRSVNPFSIRSAAFYEAERRRAKSCLKAFQDQNMKKESAEGFVITAALYENSPVVTDYVAKRLVNDIFFGSSYNRLEYLIHRDFKSIDEFESYGAVQFLADNIFNFDRCLHSYLFGDVDRDCFNEIFAGIAKSIDVVKYRWPIYMDKLNQERVLEVLRSISSHMVDDNLLGSLSFEDIISYAALKNGVIDIFRRYNFGHTFNYDEEKYRVVTTEDVKNMNMALALTSKLFKRDVMPQDSDDNLRFELADAQHVGAKK